MQAPAQQLVLYTMPAPKALNWRSPHTLFMSYLENLLVHTRYPQHRHPLGHLIVELHDTSHYALVGTVAESRADLYHSVMKYRYGLGALFSTFKGKIETAPDNFHQLIDRYPHGDVAYIKFLLNEDAFARLWQYLQEYQARGYDKMYNGYNKPREGKGAGCSAFAVSFVELAALLDSTVLKQWMVRVNVQDKLIGGPEGGNKRINTFWMAFTQRWADTARQAYKPLVYYEPTLVYKWIHKEWSKADSSLGYGVQRREKTEGIVIDCRNYPSPGGSIWLVP